MHTLHFIDLPSLLRVWTALQHNRLAIYGVAKWRKISSSMCDFWARIFHTPPENMLKIVTVIYYLINLIETKAFSSDLKNTFCDLGFSCNLFVFNFINT